MKHPNFIVGLMSYVSLLLGVVMKANSFRAGTYIIALAVLLGGVHWINSIFDVYKDPNLKKEESSRYLWIALVIMIPPIAGMLYYMMKQKKVTI